MNSYHIVDNTTTYHYVDNTGMVLVRDDAMSWRDSIGRNVLCLFAYGWDTTLIDGLENCLKYTDSKWRLYRHPEHHEELSSKDHWSYFIMYRRLFSDDNEFNNFISEVPRITGLYNWMYAIGGSKYDQLGYYLIQIPGAWLGNIYNKALRIIAGVKGDWEFTQDDWVKGGSWLLVSNLDKWAIWCRKRLIPTYSLHNKAWQIHFLPDSRWRNLLKRLLFKRLPKNSSNYLLKLLFGSTVTKEEVDNYQHMTGYRWGVFLNWENDRDVQIIDKERLGVYPYEKDLLTKIFHELKNIL